MHAKRRVIVRRVVAMLYCRSVQIEGFSYKTSNRGRHRDNAPHDNAPFGVFR
jgi:hypothetical protein